MSDGEPLTLEIPGLSLAALAWGPPDGVPVLACHGWLDNAASFSRLAEHLPGVRLVALDLPGHGLSGHRPAGVSYHFIDWVVDVAAAGEALGWERYALLGHSMGAGITSLIAGTIPERITHLALIEGLGPMAVSADEAPLRLARSIGRRAARERKRPRHHPDRATAEERLRQVNPTLSAEAARRLVARGTRQEAEGVVWVADSRLRGLSPMRITEEHVHAFLRRIACPTLIVRGREGYAYDAKMLAARLACVDDARVVEVPGGHHVHLDDPAPVAEQLAPFLGAPGRVGESASDAPVADLGVSLERLRIVEGIRLLILDCDGVLTTGAIDYGPEGNDRLCFDVKDGMGIAMLRRAGIEVAILSGRSSPAVQRRAETLGITQVHLGVRDKLPRLEAMLAELGLEPRQAAYLGDDLNDIAVMRAVGFPAAPADGRPEAREAARLVLGRPGGRGAVRELAEHLLKAQGKWAATLAHYRIE